jgi:hypothetical protein
VVAVIGQKLDLNSFFIIFSKPAWFVPNDGSLDSDFLSHIPYNMAWFASKMAWLQIHLVQLQIFWTSIALIFATWQHFMQGYCCLLQVHQLSYIVLDLGFIRKNIKLILVYR